MTFVTKTHSCIFNFSCHWISANVTHWAFKFQVQAGNKNGWLVRLISVSAEIILLDRNETTVNEMHNAH